MREKPVVAVLEPAGLAQLDGAQGGLDVHGVVEDPAVWRADVQGVEAVGQTDELLGPANEVAIDPCPVDARAEADHLQGLCDEASHAPGRALSSGITVQLL